MKHPPSDGGDLEERQMLKKCQFSKSYENAVATGWTCRVCGRAWETRRGEAPEMLCKRQEEVPLGMQVMAALRREEHEWSLPLYDIEWAVVSRQCGRCGQIEDEMRGENASPYCMVPLDTPPTED